MRPRRVAEPVRGRTAEGHDPDRPAWAAVCQTGRMGPHGQAAERLVFERVRTALPAVDFNVYANAEWLGPMREGGPARDGEADLVIVHEDRGILVLEVKSGAPTRDGAGRWWIGGHELDRDPFSQAKDSKTSWYASWRRCPPGRPGRTLAPATPSPCPTWISPACCAVTSSSAPMPRASSSSTRRHSRTPRLSAAGWSAHTPTGWAMGRRATPLGALGVRLIDEILAPMLVAPPPRARDGSRTTGQTLLDGDPRRRS